MSQSSRFPGKMLKSYPQMDYTNLAEQTLILLTLVAEKYNEESGEELTTEEFSMNDAEDAKKYH